MSVGLDTYLCWLLIEQVKQNRDIVRGEIPDDISILAKEAQIDANGLETVDPAQIIIADQFTQLVDCRTVFKGVTDHQDALPLLSQTDQLLSLGHARSQRLFDEHMLIMFKGCTRKGVVG